MAGERKQAGEQVTALRRVSAAAACFTLLTAGCVAGGYAGDGGGYDGTVGYDAGYYEPYGVDYGGWGSGYEVGPYYDGGGRYRDGGRAEDRGGRAAAQHAYRSAPSSHAMPSIPSGPRGGGAHGAGGGARGGGGRSR
jgi:hypothetical protein